MRVPALTVALTVLVAGCSETKPDRLAMDPSGPFEFEKKGQAEEVKLAAFAGTQPYVKVVPATWGSSDASVATVDDRGKITAVSSGKATITASAWGIDTKADVVASIVGSVGVLDNIPKPFKLSHKPVQLKVTVKDDRGQVIEKPPVIAYRATDYCVEVDDDGLVKPLAEGDCDIEIRCQDKHAKLQLSVKE